MRSLGPGDQQGSTCPVPQVLSCGSPADSPAEFGWASFAFSGDDRASTWPGDSLESVCPSVRELVGEATIVRTRHTGISARGWPWHLGLPPGSGDQTSVLAALTPPHPPLPTGSEGSGERETRLCSALLCCDSGQAHASLRAQCPHPERKIGVQPWRTPLCGVQAFRVGGGPHPQQSSASESGCA